MITRYPPRPRGEEPASALLQSGISHHQRHCKICSHPERVDLEADFVEWDSPREIAREYNVSRAAVYRHARAVGLFDRRGRNLRFALGRVIERAGYVQPTADSIVRAIHAFARINDCGQWVEPPAHVIVSSGAVRREAPAPRGRRPIALSLDPPAPENVADVSAPTAMATPAADSPLEDELPAASPVVSDSGVLPGHAAMPLFTPGPCEARHVALPETLSRVEIDATH